MTYTQKTNRFFWITLIVIMMGCPAALGVLTWIFLGPETFWQNMASGFLGTVVFICTLVPFGFLMYFLNEWFDRWLIKRKENRKRQQANEQREYERRKDALNSRT